MKISLKARDSSCVHGEFRLSKSVMTLAGRQGMKDEEIIPFLHQLRHTTFFTRDLGFYDRQLSHANYCLVILAVGQYEVASFIRRFLQHPQFKTKSKRMGTVVRVTHSEIQMWQLYAEREEHIKWLF